MTDEKIVNLYWARSENAIEETSNKYGSFCYSIAYGILRNHADSEECVNDTYLGAWSSMPTERPVKLAPFLGKITRNLSINKYNYYTAKKRGGTQVPLILEELLECVSGQNDTENIVDTIHFEKVINDYLSELNKNIRGYFICRYWYAMSIKEISKKYGTSQNNVKVALHRTRKALKEILEKEGLY